MLSYLVYLSSNTFLSSLYIENALSQDLTEACSHIIVLISDLNMTKLYDTTNTQPFTLDPLHISANSLYYEISSMKCSLQSVFHAWQDFYCTLVLQTNQFWLNIHQ